MTYLCEKEKVRKNELTREKLRLLWEEFHMKLGKKTKTEIKLLDEQ